MATRQAHDSGEAARLADELPPITPEDVAHFAARLEEGLVSGEYTGLRESDLDVLTHLTPEQWEQVKRDPSMLQRILVPPAHA